MQRLLTSQSLGSFLAVFVVGLFGTQLLAQSTHDLKPPAQPAVSGGYGGYGGHIIDPSSMPKFIFAVAAINPDGNVEIERSFPFQKYDTGDGDTETYTEMVSQNYTVQIPYTETLTNGKTVTKMRSETRTRTIPVTRVRPVGGGKAAPKGMEAYTENVTQSYTVNVPYTEMVDGKPVLRTRTETRTRTVPVQRFRKVKGADKDDDSDEKDEAEEKVAEAEAPKVEMKKVPYFVQVPYTENVDGKAITKFRLVRRTRTVPIMDSIKTTSNALVTAFALQDVEGYSIDGEAIEAKELKKRLVEKVPVILINDAKDIVDNPYFKFILKSDAIFLVEPSAESVKAGAKKE